jgi:TonB family protein
MKRLEPGRAWTALVAAAAAAAVLFSADAFAAGTVQESVFLVPQIRCDTAPAGQAAGPTGFGVALSAMLREPAAVGHYLDLARCHVTSAFGPRLAEAEDMLNQALSRVTAERRAHPAPANVAADARAPLRVGGVVPSPVKLKDAPATYPAEARAAGISGVVFVDALIDVDGNVTAAKVVGSIPALDAAAVAAVQQWKYAPTAVDGKAVDVVKLVTIKFSTTPGSTPADGIDIARFHEAQGHFADAETALTQTIGLVRDLRRQTPATKASSVRLTSGVAGDIHMPVKIYDARPIYPKGAAEKKLQGVVVLEATITKDGLVTNVRVLQSAPGLDDAALAAVRQWRYTPATNDGMAADVITTVTINFAP